MPNLIHSLDASNIYIFCRNINKKMGVNKLPLYIIHDCFASSANNLKIMENIVKSSFIEIYFGGNSYIEKMHSKLIEQIRSYTNILKSEDGEYIIINTINLPIPKIPNSFLDPNMTKIFIDG